MYTDDKTIMKKLLTLLSAGVLMSALCAGFVACNEPEGPELQGEDVPFTVYSLQEDTSGEEFSARWINLDYDKNYEAKILVIDSEEELENYVEGDYPAIDFAQKTLVLTYGCNSGMAFGSDGLKFQQVSEGSYVITASTLATALDGIFEWEIAIAVDKLPSGSKIKFNGIVLNS